MGAVIVFVLTANRSPLPTHAPRVGCDIAILIIARNVAVSIHAPRVGRDKALSTPADIHIMFQFTHPVWGATPYAVYPRPKEQFQFTHPVRGATARRLYMDKVPMVSIHAPRAGCDIDGADGIYLLTQFQFTHPVRGATS